MTNPFWTLTSPEPEPAPEPASESPEGLEDAADVDCITPDGWYATEVFDDLNDEEH